MAPSPYGSVPEPLTFLGLGISQWVVVIAILAVVASAVLMVLMARRGRRPRPRKSKAYNAEAFRRKITLDEMGFPTVSGVLVPGRNGEAVRVDHVVRLPASVLMVLTGPLDAAGRVSASAHAGLWRYVGADGKIATYTNPVVQLKSLVQALRARYPLVRVRLLTVFPDTAQFINGVPETVCLAADFKAAVRALAHADGDPSESMEAAWEPLAAALTHRRKAS